MADTQQSLTIVDLPYEILESIGLYLNHQDLCKLDKVAPALRPWVTSDDLWCKLFEKRWGGLRDMHQEAAGIAGNWRALYKSKHLTDASSNGWSRPCEHELHALLNKLARTAAYQTLDPQNPVTPPSEPNAGGIACVDIKHNSSSSMEISPASPVSIHNAHMVLSPVGSARSYSGYWPYPSRSPAFGHKASFKYGEYVRSSSTAMDTSSSPMRSSSMGPDLFVVGSAGSSGVMMSPPWMQPAQAVPPIEVQMVYLLDGSGSVSEDDFSEMKRFVVTSAPVLTKALGPTAYGKAGIIQFSTEPRVELPLSLLEDQPQQQLQAALDAIVRINGGTNIATAIARAGSMMKAEEPAVPGVNDETAAGHSTPNSTATSSGNAATSPRSSGSMSVHSSPFRNATPTFITAVPQPGSAGGGVGSTGSASAGARHGQHGGGMLAHVTGPIAAAAWRAAEEAARAPQRLLSSMIMNRGAWPVLERSEEDGATGPASAAALPPTTPAEAKPPKPVRLVLLLTDGRVDTYQAREARATACRLCDELSGCTLAAFGVGRGVDRAELLHIIDTPQGDTESRYLDLYTRDDAPW